MFDALSDKFHDVFRKLRGQAVISESNVTEALKDIRLALLEADVNYDVAKEFVESVKAEALGQSVLKSVTPGQQIIKIVNDKLTELMGHSVSKFDLSGSPSVILLVGLHGSGKTTTAAKLALYLKKNGRKVMLAAGDIYRPAAIDQLEILGKEISVPVFADRLMPRVDMIAGEAKNKAKLEGFDTLIIDTAGRFQIDEEMVQELISVSHAVLPNEIIFVSDSALGQEAVSVSQSFHNALGLTGIILTKLDGDARGGAALSIKKVTSCPIKMIGVGEKLEDLEVFHPDRMASRILGMGDVVSLVEKAAEEIDAEETEKLQRKLKANQFDLNDLLGQMKQMKKLGGMEKILGMFPGGKALSSGNVDFKEFAKVEAMICSMTPKERENPDIIDFSRRKRIARGSAATLEKVNGLLNQFAMMKKVMKKPGILGNAMSAMGGGGMMGGMPQMPRMGGFGGGQRGSNFTKPKEKRKKRR
ncbi:MAG TPA: signal recognition particle protein [Lentisphaeria bacterium]|nr:MAG: signal recognition particle protein [Lentisphaerae bacterium GWF2_38_69]HBM17188.1 signal recognition particle protein [Lentisphaeria bacterium]